jgi:adenylate cyclase
MTTPTLAILPFDDQTPGHAHGHLGEGFVEELLDALGRVSVIRCAPRPLSAQFHGVMPDPKLIAERLQVDFVLHGALQAWGERMQLTVRLITAPGGQQLWNHEYERPVGEIFQVLDDILVHLLVGLSVPADQGAGLTVRTGLTRDPVAFTHYLRGQQAYHRHGRKHINPAREAFTEACKSDPNFARAWTRLSDSLAKYVALYDANDAEAKRLAAASADKALAIEPKSAPAHVARGVAWALIKEFTKAEAEFEQAEQIDPNLFTAYYNHARVCFQEGRLKKAADLFEKAAAIRPRDYQTPLLLKQVYMSLGRGDEAQATSKLGIQLAVKHLELYPEDARAIYLASGSMIQLGMYKQAIEWAERALTVDSDDPMINYNVACCFAQAGEYDRALDCLEKAKGSGIMSAGWLKNDSDLFGLHGQPRFQALLKDLEGT